MAEFFIIALTYVVIGFAVALLFFYVFRKRFLGSFWGALIVALVGAFLGGLIDVLFGDLIERLANLYNTVNIFPPILTALLFIWVFSKISASRRDE